MTAGPGCPTGRVLAPLVVVGTVIVAVALTLSSPVGAAENGSSSQFLSIELEPIGDVAWEAQRPVAAEVTVEAARAVSGLLEVSDQPEGGSETVWEFDLDLAAGSTVRLPVTLTTGWSGVNAVAVFRSGGDALATAQLRQGGTGPSSGEHVAVLGIDDPPRRVAELGSGEPLPVLELGADLRALDDASSVIATPAAVRELGTDSAARLGLDAWIRGGGQLIVDGPTESLEGAYHRFPTANPDRFGLGAGSILYDEGWRDGIPLGGYVGSEGLARLVEAQGLGSGSGGELALLAGLALPGAGVVAAVLLGYAVLAGPVLFIVAGSTGRHRRIWTVLPALALVVASGILVIGFVDRRNRSDAHITIVEVNPAGSRATTNLLVGSGFGGNRELAAPEGWRYLGQGRTLGQRPVRLRVGPSTTEVGIEMSSGSNAVVRMTGPAPDYDGLLTIDDIEAGADGAIRAEVTNNGDVTLTEAVAFLGNARAEIGELAPGATVEVLVEPDDGSTRTMRELLLWPRVEQRWNERGPVAVPAVEDAMTAAGAWTEWRIDQGMTASPENVLGVAAWTDRMPSPLGTTDRGRTVLFARANVPAGLGPATGFATVSRLPGYTGEPIFENNFVGYREDVRVSVGTDVEAGDLALAVDGPSSAVGLWIDGAWRYVELPATGRAVIAVPEGAVVGGELVARSYQPEWAWGSGATLRVVTDDGEAEPAVLSDTVSHRNAQGPFPDERFGPGGPNGLGDLPIVESVEVGAIDEDEPFVHASYLDPSTQASFTVTLEAGQGLMATMRSPDRDSFLELWDGDGNLLESNDDFGERVDSRIVFTATEAGVYELRARELGGGDIRYELTVELDS